MTHVLIVAADFYKDITDELLRGAVDTLKTYGVSYDVVTVPGAFEIPGAICFAINNDKYTGFIALGCVIRGETTHYDYVCGQSATGLMSLTINHKAAIGYGILTVENEAQAWARARVSEGNKGKDAADACLRMIELKETLK